MQVILDDIKTSIDILARKINAPRDLMPGYGHSIGEDHVYIKVDKHGQLYYVLVDSEGEYEYPSPDINDLLYRVFRSITFSMSAAFLVDNVNEKEDYLLQYFSKQLEFLLVLNKDWRNRAEQEHQVLLKPNPLDVMRAWENYSK